VDDVTQMEKEGLWQKKKFLYMARQVDLILRRLGQPMAILQNTLTLNLTPQNWRRCWNIPEAFGKCRLLLKGVRRRLVMEGLEGSKNW
jgi:hypothetical protein